jgi:hypothetical protein
MRATCRRTWVPPVWGPIPLGIYILLSSCSLILTLAYRHYLTMFLVRCSSLSYTMSLLLLIYILKCPCGRRTSSWGWRKSRNEFQAQDIFWRIPRHTPSKITDGTRLKSSLIQDLHSLSKNSRNHIRILVCSYAGLKYCQKRRRSAH